MIEAAFIYIIEQRLPVSIENMISNNHHLRRSEGTFPLPVCPQYIPVAFRL